MVTKQQYTLAVRRLDKARTTKARAEGQLQAALAQIRDLCGAKTLDGAKAKLQDLDDKAQALKADADAAMVEFEDAWRGLRDGDA